MLSGSGMWQASRQDFKDSRARHVLLCKKKNRHICDAADETADLVAGEVEVGERACRGQRRGNATEAVALQVQHAQACQVAPGRQVLQFTHKILSIF